MREQGAPTAISKQALQRMPYYIRFLREMEAEGLTVVAAPAVAARLGLNEVQQGPGGHEQWPWQAQGRVYHRRADQ